MVACFWQFLAKKLFGDNRIQTQTGIPVSMPHTELWRTLPASVQCVRMSPLRPHKRERVRCVVNNQSDGH